MVAMTLHSNYNLVLNHKAKGPTKFMADPLVFTTERRASGPHVQNHGDDVLPRYVRQGDLPQLSSCTDILSRTHRAFQVSTSPGVLSSNAKSAAG